MIEKIVLSEVEKKLPEGKPNYIRALDSNEKSILSTIDDVGATIGLNSVRRTFKPLEELEIRNISGCLILAQDASSQHDIGAAIIYTNNGGVVLNNVSGISFMRKNEKRISIYRNEENRYLYIKNNMNVEMVVYARFIPIL